MQRDLQAFLWDDLSDVRTRLEQVEATLRALQSAIDAGSIDQPSRQDSKRLNRLMVLAELLSAELRPWAERFTPRPLPSHSNGSGARD